MRIDEYQVQELEHVTKSLNDLAFEHNVIVSYARFELQDFNGEVTGKFTVRRNRNGVYEYERTA